MKFFLKLRGGYTSLYEQLFTALVAPGGHESTMIWVMLNMVAQNIPKGVDAVQTQRTKQNYRWGNL